MQCKRWLLSTPACWQGLSFGAMPAAQWSRNDLVPGSVNQAAPFPTMRALPTSARFPKAWRTGELCIVSTWRPRMPQQRWTEQKIEELRSFIKAGGSPARAAARFKCSDSALRTKAAELGLHFPTIKTRRLQAFGYTGFSVDRRFKRWKEPGHPGTRTARAQKLPTEFTATSSESVVERKSA